MSLKRVKLSNEPYSTKITKKSHSSDTIFLFFDRGEIDKLLLKYFVELNKKKYSDLVPCILGGSWIGIWPMIELKK